MSMKEQLRARDARTEARGYSVYPYIEAFEAIEDKNLAKIVHRMSELLRKAAPAMYSRPGEDTKWIEEYSWLIDGHGEGAQ